MQRAHTYAFAGAWGVYLWVQIGAALAQDQPRVIDRPSERPLETPGYLPEGDEKPFELPPVYRPSGVPKSEPSGPELQVRDYVFEGNKVLPTDVLKQIAEPYSKRTLRQSELEELRQKLSRAYADRGYINSGALLPTDFYRDGIVTFRIVEGRSEELRATGLKGLREEYLRQRLLPDAKPLNANLLQERCQLLLTDPLFEKVNARLQPGSEPGQAILDVDVVRARPWDLSLYANNYRPPSIGAEALGVTGTVRNSTNAGDTLSASLEYGRDLRATRYSVDWSAPVVYRTDLNVRYQHGDSAVIEEPLSVLDIKSVLNSFEMGLSHALLDTLAHRVSVGASYTHRSNSTALLDQPFSFVLGEPTGKSIVNAWRFEQDWLNRGEAHTLAARSTLTWGHTNTVVSNNPEVPPQHYFVWIAQGKLGARVLQNGTSVFLRGTYQWTDDRLVPLEQISLGGVSSVRGYSENRFVRDLGYSGSIEVRYPLVNRAAQQIRLTLVPFFDFGEAWNKDQQRQRLRSVGLGLTWQLRRLFGEVYYGSQLVNIGPKPNGNLQHGGFHFQAQYVF